MSDQAPILRLDADLSPGDLFRLNEYCEALVRFSAAKATALAAEAAKEIERLRAPAAGPPLATGSEKKSGWTLDFEWLEKMRNEVEKATGYDATIEVIEETVLRTLEPGIPVSVISRH